MSLPSMQVSGTARSAEFTSKGSKGAASEMFACAHLLSQGYHVFRSVSPSCPVDGIAYRDGKCVRFEVKSLRLGGGECIFAWPTNDEWDLLLLVAEGQVFEFQAPQSYQEVRDEVRRLNGLSPVPFRAPRGSGSGRYTPLPVVHGTWAGYLHHKRSQSPICGQCEVARGEHVQESRERSLRMRRRTTATVTATQTVTAQPIPTAP